MGYHCISLSQRTGGREYQETQHETVPFKDEQLASTLIILTLTDSSLLCLCNARCSLQNNVWPKRLAQALRHCRLAGILQKSKLRDRRRISFPTSHTRSSSCTTERLGPYGVFLFFDRFCTLIDEMVSII